MPRKVIKFLSFLLCFCLLFEQSGLAQVAGELDISGHIAQLRNSLIQDKFRPLHLRYLSYDNLSNNFKLLLDKGDLKNLRPQELESSTKDLLNFFFVGISLPNDSFWVNLRPDSPEQIIDDALATTDVGKILLEADLQLKKDTAKFTSPETPEGKEYWDKLYKKAEEIFGSSNITIPTLTRPWIVPDKIIIRETQDNAYIYKATLKVMLEQDYLKDSAVYNFKDERLKALNEYSSQLIRELIIPKLIKDVNTAKRYAALRQVYYSLILAQWFKSRFYGKGGLYSWLIDKKNLNGITSQENWSKSTYFKAYQQSFKDGEYNIRTPISTPYGQTIRSYFSGGIMMGGEVVSSAIERGLLLQGNPKKSKFLEKNNNIPMEIAGGSQPFGKTISSSSLPPNAQLNELIAESKKNEEIDLGKRDFVKKAPQFILGLAAFLSGIAPSTGEAKPKAKTKQSPPKLTLKEQVRIEIAKEREIDYRTHIENLLRDTEKMNTFFRIADTELFSFKLSYYDLMALVLAESYGRHFRKNGEVRISSKNAAGLGQITEGLTQLVNGWVERWTQPADLTSYDKAFQEILKRFIPEAKESGVSLENIKDSEKYNLQFTAASLFMNYWVLKKNLEKYVKKPPVAQLKKDYEAILYDSNQFKTVLYLAHNVRISRLLGRIKFNGLKWFDVFRSKQPYQHHFRRLRYLDLLNRDYANAINVQRAQYNQQPKVMASDYRQSTDLASASSAIQPSAGSPMKEKEKDISSARTGKSLTASGFLRRLDSIEKTLSSGDFKDTLFAKDELVRIKKQIEDLQNKFSEARNIEERKEAIESHMIIYDLEPVEDIDNHLSVALDRIKILSEKISSEIACLHPNDIAAGLTPGSTIKQRSGIADIKVAGGVGGLPVTRENIHPIIFDAVVEINKIKGIKTSGSGPDVIYGSITEEGAETIIKSHMRSAAEGLPITLLEEGRELNTFFLLLAGHVKLKDAKAHWDEFVRRLKEKSAGSPKSASSAVKTEGEWRKTFEQADKTVKAMMSTDNKDPAFQERREGVKYHNGRHITELMDFFDAIQREKKWEFKSADSPWLVKLAILFHDTGYFQSKPNEDKYADGHEKRSKDIVKSYQEVLGLSDAEVAAIQYMIGKTELRINDVFRKDVEEENRIYDELSQFIKTKDVAGLSQEARDFLDNFYQDVNLALDSIAGGRILAIADIYGHSASYPYLVKYLQSEFKHDGSPAAKQTAFEQIAATPFFLTAFAVDMRLKFILGVDSKGQVVEGFNNTPLAFKERIPEAISRQRERNILLMEDIARRINELKSGINIETNTAALYSFATEGEMIYTPAEASILRKEIEHFAHPDESLVASLPMEKGASSPMVEEKKLISTETLERILSQWLKDKAGQISIRVVDGKEFEFRYFEQENPTGPITNNYIIEVRHNDNRIGFLHFHINKLPEGPNKAEQSIAIMDTPLRTDDLNKVNGQERFFAVFVDNDYREKGIGGALLDIALGIARMQGASRFEAKDVYKEDVDKPLLFETRGFIAVNEDGTPFTLNQPDRIPKMILLFKDNEQSAGSPVEKIDAVLEKHVGDKTVSLAELAEQTGLSITEVIKRINEINKDNSHALKIDSAGFGNVYITKKSSASSALEGEVGGIDLRNLPSHTIIQQAPVGLSAPSTMHQAPMPLSELDNEWKEIQNMLNAGIIPSCERIKEFLQASCASQDCSQRIDSVLGCLADILRLEEERVASTEPVLKDILVLLESDKPAAEMQLALAKITVSPKEPEVVEP